MVLTNDVVESLDKLNEAARVLRHSLEQLKLSLSIANTEQLMNDGSIAESLLNSINFIQSMINKGIKIQFVYFDNHYTAYVYVSQNVHTVKHTDFLCLLNMLHKRYRNTRF